MAPLSLADRIVGYSELRPCTTAFIDTRTPGSDRKENFTIIGSGVSESPEQHVHIDIPHGFNLGGARQPPGCVNSQHSHDTAEVFMVHTGTWAFYTGEMADDAEAILTSGDTISIPTQVFRGFKNVGEDTGFMFAVLGEDDPGRVTWAPGVFEAAEHHGLVLLENGQLVDRSKGEVAPPNAKPMRATTREQAASMRRLDQELLRQCVVRYEEIRDSRQSGVAEFPIIGSAPSEAGLAPGKLAWPHGFSLRYVHIESGASTGLLSRNEEQVVMVHRGELGIEMADGGTFLGSGDVATIPVGSARRLFNRSTAATEIFVVYRGDQVPPLEPSVHA